MPQRRLSLLVLVASAAALVVGMNRTPLWDEDEPRFAAIARAMVETGDWVVPIYNDQVAVDKPVLMHWCMAAAMTVCGINEFACRLPSVLATLATALALLRAGSRWRDPATGALAAVAYVGCLLVAIESHAATPDAILVALTAWATLLAVEPFLPEPDAGRQGGAPRRLSAGRAIGVGLLAGLAVVCKGPIGFIGPLAVIGPWVVWMAWERRRSAAPGGRAPFLATLLSATVEAVVGLRPLLLVAAALAAAAPWYVAVAMRTGGEWTAGFFLVHNVGRFMAPMEKHGGGPLFHPLTMLVGFYPWSCFLPLAIVLAAWRVRRGTTDRRERAILGLLLVWLAVWVGGFSAAATKLPNYVLPAYPAAAFLVAILGVAAARRATSTPGWDHPRWLATGLACLALGGVATAATIVVVARYGLPGVEPAAVVGIVPIVAAVVAALLARRNPQAAVAAFAAAALLFTALAAGPVGQRLAAANPLPGFVRELQARAGGSTRIGTYLLASPNVVFYSNGHVAQFAIEGAAAAGRFLHSGTDAVLLVPEDRHAEIAPTLPAGFGIVGRVRPAFRRHDVLALGVLPEGAADRTATTRGTTR
jgi:4-amino-4-deoxy-L-arabinose transferase-like glycosyltransferase